MDEKQVKHLENFPCPVGKEGEVEVVTLECIMEINCAHCLDEIYHAVGKRLRAAGWIEW